HEGHLVESEARRVRVAEDDVDGPVRTDDRVRALVVVADTPARRREDADRRVHAVDLDACRPGVTAVGGLAEVDGDMPGAEPGPGDVDVVVLRATGVRIGDHELLV